MRFQIFWPQIQMCYLYFILDIVLSYDIITYIPVCICIYTLLNIIYSFGTKLGRINDDNTFIFEWTNP